MSPEAIVVVSFFGAVAFMAVVFEVRAALSKRSTSRGWKRS